MAIIDKVKPLIDKLLETDFRISDKIINEILTLNNENQTVDKCIIWKRQNN